MACIVDNIYSLIESIGKGNFGEVFKTIKKGYNGYLATKKMDSNFCELPQIWKRFSNEVNVIMKMNHPNIIKFIDLKRTVNHWYLITEYANGGSLSSNLKKYLSIYHKPFSEEITQHLMKQIVSAVKYLHFNKIIHRDLKLDNILVNYPSDYDKQTLNLKNSQIKVIDFGFATILNNPVTFTALGTPNNMDPKILEQINTGVPNQGYNESVDIWSLGTLCYEMVVGHSPFTGVDMQDLYQKVYNGDYQLPLTLSEEIVSFINSMLQQDEEKRANAKQLMNHPFLNNHISTFHPLDVRKIEANYLSGGMIKMKSKEIEINNSNNNYDVWSVFNQPGIFSEAMSVNQIPTFNGPQMIPQNQIIQNGFQSQNQLINQQQDLFYI